MTESNTDTTRATEGAAPATRAHHAGGGGAAAGGPKRFFCESQAGNCPTPASG